MTLPIYLGDGVYLDHDGYQFWLAVNDHRDRVIALDPSVFAAFVRFGALYSASLNNSHERVAELLEGVAQATREAAPPITEGT